MSMDTVTGRASKPDVRMPMTPARRLTLAVGLPVLAALIGWTGLSVVANVGTSSIQFSNTLPVTHGTLTADLEDGDVALVTGSSARLTGTLTYSLIRPHLTIHGTSVSYRCPIPTGECSLNSTLSVPSGDDVNLSSALGDLTVNGGITARNMRLSTGTGNLTANGPSGNSVSLSSIAGDITASGINSGDVTVSSVSGDVTLTFARIPPDSKVTVSSTSGDVSIVLPPGPDKYRIDPSAGTGDVSDSGVPQDPSSTRVINVSSNSGDISITTG